MCGVGHLPSGAVNDARVQAVSLLDVIEEAGLPPDSHVVAIVPELLSIHEGDDLERFVDAVEVDVGYGMESSAVVLVVNDSRGDPVTVEVLRRIVAESGVDPANSALRVLIGRGAGSSDDRLDGLHDVVGVGAVRRHNNYELPSTAVVRL